MKETAPVKYVPKIPFPVSSPMELLKPGETTVTVVVPHRFMLQTDEAAKVVFEPGTQECPEHLSKYPYLAKNGVTIYRPEARLEKVAEKAVAEPAAAPEPPAPVPAPAFKPNETLTASRIAQRRAR